MKRTPKIENPETASKKLNGHYKDFLENLIGKDAIITNNDQNLRLFETVSRQQLRTPLLEPAKTIAQIATQFFNDSKPIFKPISKHIP